MLRAARAHLRNRARRVRSEFVHWLIVHGVRCSSHPESLKVGATCKVCMVWCDAIRRPHRSKQRRAQHPALYISSDPHTKLPQPQEDASDHSLAARPGLRSFSFSLFFSVRLSLADAVALRPMRAPPCRAASWPRSGRRPRRRSWPMTRTKRSTWSARGAAEAPRPPPPPRGLRPETLSQRSYTTVSRIFNWHDYR